MGVIQQFSCPSCQKTWKLRTGHGIRHAALGQVMEVFSEDIQRKIVAEVTGGQLPLFYFGYQAAACEHCREMAAVPVLRLIESNQTFVADCPGCGSKVEVLEEDTLVNCPACQKAKLKEQDVGIWD
ncbi:MAG: hypothetical protein HFG51_12655 [Lachnospiraceae bacterium]|mgnify:CR=1 FL=1|nr:hypothetical protein [Lachnospiraceae bacterium]